jgi:Ca-activated chloride channel homolog
MSRKTWLSAIPRGLWLATLAALLGALGYVYLKYAYAAPSLKFSRAGVDYELLSPRMLGVFLLAPYFLWLLGKSLADLSWLQRAASVALRLAFVGLLALSLARLARTQTEARVCSVFLVDVSQSVSDEAIADAEALITRALKEKPKDAMVRVVTFAKRAQAIDLADKADVCPKLARHTDLPGAGPAAKAQAPGLLSAAGAGSDIQAALELSYGLYPEGYVRRAVLLSDGVETEGSMLTEASRARRFGVSVDVLPYKRPVPGEVAIRELRVPDRVRVGEPFTLYAQVFSNREQKVKLTLKQGEAINGLDGVRQVALQKGENEVPFKSVVRVPGEVTYDLSLSEMEHDRFKENNRYAVTIPVPGKPTILYVEGQAQRASYFSSALSAQDFDVDVRGPRELPQSIRELERYDFVVLSDAPAESVSLTQQDALEQYVRDVGGGFLFAGGEAGYGLGGWAHTTVERMLPVSMDAEKKKDEPVVAMALVIDRSGSMSGLPIEMAKAAAKATADTLANDDLLEVIAFDNQPTRVVRLTAAKHRARIQGDIAKIQPGGGTEIFSALDAAYQSLSAARAKRKHVILLTDGQANANGIRELVQTMAAEGITVSSVGLGAGADQALLKMIAEEVGGGRFYPVPDPQSLPRVFTRETELVSRHAAVEEYFQPKVVTGADFLKSVDLASAPYLHGYVATRLKPAPAQEILQSDAAEPLLARWRLGLGWAIAWTSDLKNLWAVEWLRWPGYGQFWGQLVREHMRQRKRQEFKMTAGIDPLTGNMRASIDAIGGDDAFQNGLEAKLRIKGPEPGGESKTVAMRQVAPGRYESDMPLPKFGSYLLHAVLEKPAAGSAAFDKRGESTKSVQVAESFGHITNPYPREYLALDPNVAALAEVSTVTQGQLRAEGLPMAEAGLVASAPVDLQAMFDPRGKSVKHHKPLWPVFVFAAVLVYLLDVLLRRVHLGKGPQSSLKLA